VKCAVNFGTESPDESDEGSNPSNLNRPQAETVIGKMRLDAIRHRIAGCAIETHGQEFAHAAVGIE
jgi:hypothetical protein